MRTPEMIQQDIDSINREYAGLRDTTRPAISRLIHKAMQPGVSTLTTTPSGTETEAQFVSRFGLDQPEPKYRPFPFELANQG